MKRLVCTVLVVGVLCAFGGCQKKGLPRPDFPLEEAVVIAAMEQTGLPGVISASETESYSEGHISYTLRNQTESKRILTAISSANRGGERFLQVISIPPSVPESPPFAWEDWKQQLVLAALLSGGFTDEEELYRAFSEQEVPEDEEMIQWDYEVPGNYYKVCEWDARLPAGYCRVRYDMSNTSVVSSSLDTEILEQSSHMFISIYESESHDQEIRQKGVEAKEAADRARAEAEK